MGAHFFGNGERARNFLIEGRYKDAYLAPAKDTMAEPHTETSG